MSTSSDRTVAVWRLQRKGLADSTAGKWEDQWSFAPVSEWGGGDELQDRLFLTEPIVGLTELGKDFQLFAWYFGTMAATAPRMVTQPVFMSHHLKKIV